ncbi:hypothetical protein H072_231 [Dactylellina haptotyla CBS 200.50]|uniref:VWFA domain-containing protein n=1 Tax=Dactylellina haptotyla (strain CBS 200.50) TaxID=1284197 RepID=S8CDJ4_DACHA|nr:hypothetical protein H072_231 [Dactylellina haptotyla CBS 200.50]
MYLHKIRLNRGPGISWKYDPREPLPPWVSQLPEDSHKYPGRGSNFQTFAAHHATDREPYYGGPRRGELQDAEAATFSVPEYQPPPPPPPQYTPPQVPRKGFLPPLHASINARIINDTAKVSVTHLFLNENDHVIPKASYTFPLPPGCTVSEFVCRLGKDKILKGKVESKKKAVETFNNAVRQYRSAGLLEKQNDEIFTTTLGNIPAHCRLKVEISFIVLLPYNFEEGNGLTTFRLPVYIAPRFGTPPPGVAEALGESTKLNSLSIDIDVLAPENILSIESATHDVAIEMGAGERVCQTWEEFLQAEQKENGKSAHVRLGQTLSHLDRDFELRIKTKPEASLEEPQAFVETHPEFPNHKAVMLTIPPEFLLREIPGEKTVSNGEIIFLADRSGSMSDKIAPLKSAMEFFLKGIPKERHFNIFSFGSKYESLWDESNAYTSGNLEEALEHVRSDFRSNMGGTYLLPALKAVVAAKGNFQSVDIITLTDGEVWNLEDTLDYVEEIAKKTEGRVRFFCLGIGNAVSHALVEGIAKRGGGYSEIIPLAREGGWESRVVATLSAALKPHVSVVDIKLDNQKDWDTQDATSESDQKGNYLVQSCKMMQCPARGLDSSPFMRNRIFMLFESLDPKYPLSGINFIITKPGRDPVTKWVPIKHLKLPDSTIHRLAARALMEGLGRGECHMNFNDDGATISARERRGLLKGEGERLGCKWSLVSEWTSFVAVEEQFEAKDASRDAFIDEDNFVETTFKDDSDLLLAPRGTQTAGTASIEASTENTIESAPAKKIADDDFVAAEEVDLVMPMSGMAPTILDGDDSDASSDFAEETGSDWSSSNERLDSLLVKLKSSHGGRRARARERASTAQQNKPSSYYASNSSKPPGQFRATSYASSSLSVPIGEGIPTRALVDSLPPSSPPSRSGPDVEKQKYLINTKRERLSALKAQRCLRIVNQSIGGRSGRSTGGAEENSIDGSSSNESSDGLSIAEDLDSERFTSDAHKHRKAPSKRRSAIIRCFPNSISGDDSDFIPHDSEIGYSEENTTEKRGTEIQATLSGVVAVQSRSRARLREDDFDARISAPATEYDDISVKEWSRRRNCASARDSDTESRAKILLDSLINVELPSVQRPKASGSNVVSDHVGQPKSFKARQSGPLPEIFSFCESSKSVDLNSLVPSRSAYSMENTLPSQNEERSRDSTRQLEAALKARSALYDVANTAPIIVGPVSEEKCQQMFVTRLLAFQKFDGEFGIPSAEIANFLGLDFSDAIKKISTGIETDCGLWDTAELPQIALAVAIVALLEAHLPSQKTLWMLMVEKAKDFIRTYVVDVDPVIDNAKATIKDIQFYLGPTGSVVKKPEPVVEPAADSQDRTTSDQTAGKNPPTADSFSVANQVITAGEATGAPLKTLESDIKLDSIPRSETETLENENSKPTAVSFSGVASVEG